MNPKGTFIFTATVLVISTLCLGITNAPKSVQAQETSIDNCFDVQFPEGHHSFCYVTKKLCEEGREQYLASNPEHEPITTKCKKNK
jgi:hypothetical protein